MLKVGDEFKDLKHNTILRIINIDRGHYTVRIWDGWRHVGDVIKFEDDFKEYEQRFKE